MTDAARVAVVIASFSGESALRRCLASIMPQAHTGDVLVATAADGATIARVQAEFPAVHVLTAAPATNVFALRSIALQAARAPIVILTEDHCTAASGWIAALTRALDEGHHVAGGPVENRLPRPRDWALYLCEYVSLLPPLADGPTSALLGVNIAYRRAALERCGDVWREEFHESEVHDALQRAGYRQHCTAAARVSSHLCLPLADGMRHLYRGGRRFGIYRQSHSSPGQRALWLAAVPLVPLLMLSRMVRTVAQRQPARLWTLLSALPFLLGLVGAWSFGEAVGYVRAIREWKSPARREPANAAARRNAE